jgi:hypothetical protein
MKKKKKMRPKKSKAMRHISRVDMERRRQHGYLVRLMRDGVKYQKFFSDGGCGGKTACLREAKIYRDEMLELYPPSARGNMFNRKSARNSGAPVGVSRTFSDTRGYYYEFWQACWTPEFGGPRQCVKFSINKYGDKKAFRLACRARREAIAAMEK